MRNDLSPNFLVEMAKETNAPINLLIFHFDFGDVYVSDRDIAISSQVYQGIVENWGDLDTVGHENAVSSTQNLVITLWNGEGQKFSDYFLLEDPVNVFVDLYQGFVGLDFVDFYHYGEYVIQDDLEQSEASNLINIGLVTTNMRYFAEVGDVLRKEDYPKALESDLNKAFNLIVGEPGEVDCLCISNPPATTLLGSILKRPTKVYAYDDVLELNFKELNGYLQIDEEIMFYKDIREDGIGWYFNVTQRGIDGTIAIDHTDSSEILQAKEDIIYTPGQGPITSITGVKAKGQEVDPSIYSVDPTKNPPEIVFTKQPTFSEYSKGARELDEQFDQVDPSNNAQEPYWSFKNEFKSLGSIVDKTKTPLALKQVGAPLDEGQIINIFLAVKHWETKAYSNDNVFVHVEGVTGPLSGGAIGVLNKPNPKDIVDLGGEVDLDHEHDHDTGGDHEHSYSDPTDQITDPGHAHPGSIDNVYNDDYDGGRDLPYYCAPEANVKFTFKSYPNTVKRELTFGGTLVLCNSVYIRQAGKTFFYNDDTTPGASNLPVSSNVVYFQASRNLISGVPGPGQKKGFYLRFASMRTTVSQGTGQNVTYVDTIVVDPGDVSKVNKYLGNGKPIKDRNDVEDFSGPNRQLINILQDNASRSVEERFDVTNYLETVDWSFMQNRKVWLEYKPGTNSDEDVEIVVTDMYFSVEYRQRQVRVTNEISCVSVNNEIENRPDALIQYLLTQKAGMDVSKLGSVYRNPLIFRDTDIMRDTDIYVDGGTVENVPAGAAFEEAAAWFANKGYRIDGVIAGNISVKEAIKNITFQTRSKLIWDAGKAKLAIQKKLENWQPIKTLTTDDLQVKSISAKRSSVDDIVNKIDLFYMLNRASEATGSERFNASVKVEDLDSIAKHGERKNDDMWMFDLVRNQAMAEHIASYYLWALGETTTYYTLRTYLDHFDIEKQDHIRITSEKFNRLIDTPVLVQEIKRIFGSAKNDQIDILELVVQSIRLKIIKEFVSDDVFTTDSLGLSIGNLLDLSDNVYIHDLLDSNWGRLLGDSVTADDDLSFLFFMFPKLFETLNITEEISSHMNVRFDDSVTFTDTFAATELKCAGTAGFGAVPFGAITELRHDDAEVLSILEEFIISLGWNLSDSVTIDDSDMAFSDGYGSPSIGDGYDEIPYGE